MYNHGLNHRDLTFSRRIDGKIPLELWEAAGSIYEQFIETQLSEGYSLSQREYNKSAERTFSQKEVRDTVKLQINNR